jgi:hypothetical protein
VVGDLVAGDGSLLTSNNLEGDFVADHSRNKHMDKKINLESTSKIDKIKLIK